MPTPRNALVTWSVICTLIASLPTECLTNPLWKRTESSITGWMGQFFSWRPPPTSKSEVPITSSVFFHQDPTSQTAIRTSTGPKQYTKTPDGQYLSEQTHETQAFQRSHAKTNFNGGSQEVNSQSAYLRRVTVQMITHQAPQIGAHMLSSARELSNPPHPAQQLESKARMVIFPGSDFSNPPHPAQQLESKAPTVEFPGSDSDSDSQDISRLQPIASASQRPDDLLIEQLDDDDSDISRQKLKEDSLKVKEKPQPHSSPSSSIPSSNAKPDGVAHEISGTQSQEQSPQKVVGGQSQPPSYPPNAKPDGVAHEISETQRQVQQLVEEVQKHRKLTMSEMQHLQNYINNQRQIDLSDPQRAKALFDEWEKSPKTLKFKLTVLYEKMKDLYHITLQFFSKIRKNIGKKQN